MSGSWENLSTKQGYIDGWNMNKHRENRHDGHPLRKASWGVPTPEMNGWSSVWFVAVRNHQLYPANPIPFEPIHHRISLRFHMHSLYRTHLFVFATRAHRSESSHAMNCRAAIWRLGPVSLHCFSLVAACYVHTIWSVFIHTLHMFMCMAYAVQKTWHGWNDRVRLQKRMRKRPRNGWNVHYTQHAHIYHMDKCNIGIWHFIIYTI